MRIDTPSLLITDDNRELRETLQGIFQPRGFHTLLASDGQAALQIVRRAPVHLILTDMNMPRLSGLEAIRKIKQLQASMPCILISAELDDELAREAEQADVFSVLTKPFRSHDITQVVQEAMQVVYDWSWKQ